MSTQTMRTIPGSTYSRKVSPPIKTDAYGGIKGAWMFGVGMDV